MDKCAICGAPINLDEAVILTMGAYGNPRCICDECTAELDTAHSSREVEEIKTAVKSIGNKMANNDTDRQTYDTVTLILARSCNRAQKIQNGEYDFALDDESEEEGFDEIPEELAETEEDRALDERDAKRGETFDKIYNIILIIAVVAFVGFLGWKIADAIATKHFIDQIFS